MTNTAFHLFMFIAITGLLGCTPPTPLPEEEHDLQIVTTTQDTKLDTSNIKELKLSAPIGQTSTVEFFSQLRNLSEIATETQNSNLHTGIQKLVLDFYDHASTHTQVRFRDSPYVNFVIAKSQPDYLKATEDLSAFQETELRNLNQVVDATAASFEFPTESISISQALDLISRFLTAFEDRLRSAKLNSAVKSGVRAGLYQQYWLKLPAVKSIVQDMEAAQDFSASVQKLRELITTFEVDLDVSEQKKVEFAADIAESLDGPLSDKAAFALLLELWENLTPNERSQTFGEVSPELYDFLSSKKPHDRKCLQKAECHNLILRFTKDFVILPNIKKFGVDKLQAEIQKSALDRLRSDTGQVASDLVRDLPNIIKEQAAKGVRLEIARFQWYRDHYSDFVKFELQSWFERKFGIYDLPALEKAQVTITKTKHATAQFAGPTAQGPIEVSVDAFGAALSTTQAALQPPTSKELTGQLQILALTRINQLLAHGGFSLADGEPFPALSRALLRRDPVVPLNIENGLHLPSLFAIPIPTRVEEGFQIPKQTVPRHLYVRTQAQLLAGLTAMIATFRDWEITPIDRILGPIKTSELFPSLPASQVRSSAFPKEAFLALAFGNASAVVANLKAKGSPLLILCPNNQPNWGDEKASCLQPSALAALVDIINNSRVMKIETRAQADFLDSLIDFLEVAEDLNQTRSPYLVKSSRRGELSPLQEFQQSLPQIRSLALGLTNFLTHKLADENGHLSSGYDLETSQNLVASADTMTYLAVIKAVAHSADFFKFAPYKVSALNSYHYLNKHLWNESLGFYRLPKNRSPSLLELSEAVRSLQYLLPIVKSVESKAQLTEILAGWNEALLKIQL